MIASAKARLTFRIRLYRTIKVVRQTLKGGIRVHSQQDSYKTIIIFISGYKALVPVSVRIHILDLPTWFCGWGWSCD
jgi:hypothetical protein